MRIYHTLATRIHIAFAPADAARGGGNDMKTVAEIVTFKQGDGIKDSAVISAASGTEVFVHSAPGFISRHLSKSDDGTWTDHILWADMDSAMAAGKAAVTDPSFAPFMQAIAPGSVAMRHERVIWKMDGYQKG